MIDVQRSGDERNVELDKVGVRDVGIPLKIKDMSRKFQHVSSKVDCFVNLPHDFRGTHMSRFIEVLNKHRARVFNSDVVRGVLSELKEKLDADSAHIVVRFPYFVEKTSPVSSKKSVMEYECAFFGDFCESFSFMIEVKVPVATLCPCSKEISDFGAHNQRGIVTVLARCSKFVWIEEIIRMAEESASSEVFSLLKRSDEKFVTERMYDKPMFVEDVVREVVLRLRRDKRVSGFRVECENFESIHAHNAYALVDRL
ncbi:MAG: GTP cyclohydrolase FolE2 [archaeon]